MIVKPFKGLNTNNTIIIQAFSTHEGTVLGHIAGQPELHTLTFALTLVSVVDGSTHHHDSNDIDQFKQKLAII